LRDFPERAGLFDIGELQLGSQIIRNHNGLLGRYPGADGMKTGFTCPAGFNVVATANHYGRRLITVVLGMPSAKLRNQEAADLFDRGFAMGSGSGSLDSLASTVSGPPDRRANVCLHRSAAAIAAEEEEGAAEETASRSGGRGGGIIAALAASVAPTRTVLSNERPEFDPVPVFIGPVAGWNGPILGPRKTTALAEAPSAAKAYVGVQPDAVENANATGEPNAPKALDSAVRTPPAEHKHHLKPVKHRTMARNADKTAPKTEKSEAAKAEPVTPPAKPPGDQ
jgi:D-alanyl-D-alanine carboxypeptidase